MDSGNAKDNLTAAFVDTTTVIIRICGRASFRISPLLKQFIQQVFESESINRILINMADCSGMDSTFMGVLAGIAYHIRDQSGVKLKLVNLSEKNQKLLTTLGVQRLINYSPGCTEEEKELLAVSGEEAHSLESGGADRLETARTTLEAHKNLVKAHPENLTKFKSIIEFLQNDVRDLEQR
jgi:anti-anti-sigma factor